MLSATTTEVFKAGNLHGMSVFPAATPSRCLIACLAFCGLLTSWSGDRVEARAVEPPNIVFILVDDLGWSDLGCYGHRYHRTPEIDRLAETGLRFTDGYAPAPICSASRASILTGKTVARLGFEFVTKHESGHQKLDSDVPLQTPPFTLNLPLQEVTIAERLSALAYDTAFFGKWHVSQHYQRRYLAWHPQFGPRKQGFAVATEDFGDHPYAWGKRTPRELPKNVFPDDSMVNRVANYIRQQADHTRPFFVMASMFYVHTPVRNRCQWLVQTHQDDLAEDAVHRRQRLEYAAFVETLDHHVGTIVDAVEQSGKRDQTLILFMSDNGGHPEYCSNAPLRGSKWNLYEGGIRVPLIASWPEVIAPGRTTDTPVIGYDILPTLVDLAGGGQVESDGASFRGLLNDNESELDRTLVWHFPYYHPETTYSQAIETVGINDFAVSKTEPQSAIRVGNHKLIHFDHNDRDELYDLSSDLSEQKDRSTRAPELAGVLRQKLEAELARMQARRATPKR